MVILFLRAAAAWCVGLAFVSAMIFLPAGTIAFPRGWLLIAVLFIPMLLAGAVMLIKSPQLLERRLKNKEKQSGQRSVIAASAVMFVAGFALAGLDFRFGWTQRPAWVSAAAAAVFLLGYGLYALVLRENAYASRVVEIQQGQKLIDTGLYAVVRHPMYGATVLMFLSMPLVLGSVISFLCFLAYPMLIAKRIRGEEQMLEDGLEGYRVYEARVKWKLIPFVW